MYDRATGVRFPGGAGTSLLIKNEFRAQQITFPVDPGGEFFAQEHSGSGLKGDDFTSLTPLPRSGMRAYFHNPRISPLCRVDTRKATSCSNHVGSKGINLGNEGVACRKMCAGVFER